MVELAVVVVQPEQQRPDVRARAVLVPAEAGDDAVGGALVLDLQHRPLARLVLLVELLRDDAVEAGALEPVEPVRGERPVGVAGVRWTGGAAPANACLEQPARSPWGVARRSLVAEREQVPADEATRASPRRAS